MTWQIQRAALLRSTAVAMLSAAALIAAAPSPLIAAPAAAPTAAPTAAGASPDALGPSADRASAHESPPPSIRQSMRQSARGPTQLTDGSRVVLPPRVIAQDPPAVDRRPIYVGAAVIALAVSLWWNRRRRARFDPEPPDDRTPP